MVSYRVDLHRRNIRILSHLVTAVWIRFSATTRASEPPPPRGPSLLEKLIRLGLGLSGRGPSPGTPTWRPDTGPVLSFSGPNGPGPVDNPIGSIKWRVGGRVGVFAAIWKSSENVGKTSGAGAAPQSRHPSVAIAGGFRAAALRDGGVPLTAARLQEEASSPGRSARRLIPFVFTSRRLSYVVTETPRGEPR